MVVQGLELDSNGKVYGRPKGAELQQIREEQEAWGASSEKASHAFLENLAVTGAKAAGNAGLSAAHLLVKTLPLLTLLPICWSKP